MKNQRWSLIRTVSILIAVPVLASADPVTFHYVIEVTQRCQDTDGFSRTCSPFNTTFPLMMTFDPTQVGPPLEGATFSNVDYGSPSFSPVPLTLPPQNGPFVIREDSRSLSLCDQASPPFAWPQKTSCDDVNSCAFAGSLCRPLGLEPRSFPLTIPPGRLFPH